MKTKILFMLLIGCLLSAAGWLVQMHNPVQADQIPEKYRETVHKGLEYLVKNQCQDGRWEGEGGQHPVAMTGLAGIALLMEGWEDGRGVFGKWKYSANIRKAVDWLVDKSQVGRDGLIFSEHPSETARYMYGHGLATLFLAGAYKNESDGGRRTNLKNVLSRAIKYIINAQSTQGGWYRTSKVEGHDLDEITASVIQIQALLAAENSGFSVSPFEAVNHAEDYLKIAMAKYEKTDGAGRHSGRPADTAAVLACLNNPTLDDDLRKKWFKYCQTEIPVGRAGQFGRDELTHYFYAQALFNIYAGEGDHTAWTAYRTAMFDHLLSSQNKDGSWPAPVTEGGLGIGPVFAAAVWCTVLQLDKRGHPSTQRIQEIR